MKKLILVRHGSYVTDCDSDNFLNLSDWGRHEIASLAERLEGRVDSGSLLILSSPAPRAVQSAEILAAAFGVQFETNEALSDDSSGARVCSFVRTRQAEADTIMLVSHAILCIDAALDFADDAPDSIQTGQAIVIDSNRDFAII